MRWIETDTGSNVNISSATACGAYTADADRYIIVEVFVNEVAGNGDYVMYVTQQIAGAGSAYIILPKTTMTAATGETAIKGQSGVIAVRNGDVLTAYVDGLAGDTSTPDWTTRWSEFSYLRPTTAGRTLDVTATGAAGIDWGNLENATTVNALTNTTINISGAGSTEKTYTVTDSSSGLPIADVNVWVTTDAAGANIVASGDTNSSGQVKFYLDSGTTYYIWRRKDGYNFTNPDTEIA